MQTTSRLFRSIGSPLLALAVSILWLPLSMGASAQTSEASKVSSTVIPQQVRYMGAFANRTGDTVEATFRIYATAEGGEALWTETQQVAVKADGSYSVLLGAASESGLPQGVFAGGQARWLGVSIDSAEALPRTALSSVAYAMKAGDAETVGGVAAGNLVTKDDLAKLAVASGAGVGQAQAAVQAGIEPATNPTGSGTADYVALWTTSGNLGNSNIFQASSGFLGVGTTTPGGPLQLSTGATGGANATMMLTQTSAASGNYYADIGLYNSKGLIGNLSALGAGYPSGNLFVANDVVFLGGQQNAGTNLIFLTNTSGALKFGTGGFAVSNERMRIGAAGGVSVGNSYVGTDPGAGNLIVSGKVGVGTTAPAAVLEVNGTAKFDGLVTFASGQTFPGGGGSGTITGITTSSPLTGSGTSGSVALGLSTSALETTLNGVYARLGAADTFTTAVTFNKGIVASQTGSGTYALQATGTSGSTGVYGSSDTGSGVQGKSTSAQGVVGSASAPGNDSIGVLGYTGTTYSSSYSAESAIAYAGVWADTSASNNGSLATALFATADNGYGGVVVNNTASYPALYVANSTGAAGSFAATTGDGADAGTTTGNGMMGSTSGGGDGVLGVDYGPAQQQGGVVGIANSYSTTGQLYNIYGGVWGDSGVNTANITGFAVGVLGTVDNGFAGAFYNDSNDYATLIVQNNGTAGLGSAVHKGIFSTFLATSASGTCGIGGGSMSCTGPLKSLASAGESRTVETYAMQSPENWMEDFGSGSVVDGKAVVSLDPAFAATVSGDASYKVFITPNGDSNGLYVTAKTASGFEVHESKGGTSSLSFDYRIVAKRAGYEGQRMVDVTDTFTRETSKIKLVKTEGGAKQVLPARTQSPLAQALKTLHRTVVPAPAPKGIAPQAKAAAAKQAASK
jgi:hypothetical protein